MDLRNLLRLLEDLKQLHPHNQSFDFAPWVPED